MKHTFVTVCCFLLFAFAFLGKSYAQALSSEEIKAQLVKEWERAKSYTVEYLNAMPADKYSFKAVDSIRSFAQQMLHLASGNAGLMRFATGVTAGFPQGLEKSPTAQAKD